MYIRNYIRYIGEIIRYFLVNEIFSRNYEIFSRNYELIFLVITSFSRNYEIFSLNYELIRREFHLKHDTHLILLTVAAILC